MKKHFTTAAALALLIALAGCAENNKPYDDTESPSRPESSVSSQSPVLPDTDGTSSFWAGEESESTVAAEDLEPEQPPISSLPSETQRPAEKPAPKREEQPAGGEQPQPVTPQTQNPPVSPPQPIIPPASQPQQPPAPETPSKPPASESEAPPIPTEPEAPAFDVSPYVQSAKEYGAGIGLALDSTATACWDDPLTANARSRYLERDLRDRLNWYKVSGFTAFWIWAEQTGDGEYLIYIGYA